MKEETSIQHFEWHRERVLREKRKGSPEGSNRLAWNIREIEKKHGQRAAREVEREFRSK
jgi:hypothetical protein